MNSLIVSLHDVSTQTFAVSREIMSDLAKLSVDKISLLVIPNHHRKGHFLNDVHFCTWLQNQEKLGHEIVTHGYFHQRERIAKETIRDKMITRFYTAGEGEFYDIDEASALEKMSLAQAEFRTIHLSPAGFIAPAWLLSQAGFRAAREIGFRYTTTLQEICNLSHNTSHRTQSLVYSVRSSWRRWVSIGWNRHLLGRLENNPVIRLGIHPPDWQYPEIRKEIMLLIKHLVSRREITTYAEWTAR